MSRLSPLILAALLLLLAVSLSSAQPPEVDLTWYTIDGGGSVSSDGGQYTLSGSIGQSDAGRMSNGVYTLVGGFWVQSVGSHTTWSSIYLPLLRK